ncbi:uncharacterized protein LOC125446089 isoform X3 [Sphaerodactylus townsendi]|uniref:uncharacterized protein LOC125446089 isoform X3 n=1 Tax=Sphaerodactylus townsendi TaxID=933632 RepID=UPI002026D679|nr:uncharacterized protein LOC125446089 isoform X3 [Sphaerodactylus townsendi]
MADTSGASIWLQRVRNSIENSQEWQNFTKGLFDAIQQQMRDSHVNAFLDLSEAEKAFVLQKATKAIQGGDPYQALMSQVSTCLEKEIYRQIAQEVQSGGWMTNRLTSLLTHIEDGVMTLLEERPDLKGRLRSLFNQTLPAKLRGLTWRLYLSDRKARLKYLSQMVAHKAASWKDGEISLRCQALLDSEPAFQVLKDSKVAARCLRNVLSYYHKLQGASAPLHEQDYFLPVPLLRAILHTASPAVSESVDSVSVLLVEEFLTFMKLQPWLPKLSTSQTAELELTLKTQGQTLSIQGFQDMIGKYFFHELYKQLQRDSHEPFPIYDPTQAYPPWSYQGSQTAAPPRTRPEDRRRMREERVLLKKQYEERMKEQERLQRVREEELNRQQESLLQNFEAAARKFEMQKTHLEEQLSQERQFRYEIETKAEEQIRGLQAEINRLRERKMETGSGQHEVPQLFTAQESKDFSETYSTESLPAPPPSPRSQGPTPASQHPSSSPETATGNNPTKSPKSSDGQNKAQTLMLELLKQMMETASTIFNGSNADAREQLDTATRKHLQNYQQDQTNAKIEVFGYEISEGEIEDIPEPRRKHVRNKLETIIRRGTEARYKVQLAARRNAPETVTCV